MKTFLEYIDELIPKAHVRVIGDVHGWIDMPGPTGYSYLDLIENAEYSVQVGDLGFNYSALANVDPKKHVVIGGNHDNYSNLSPHFLGDYGTYKFPGFEFFYIRGALSVDKDRRIQGTEWWPEEELSYPQAIGAIRAFIQTKPKIVITHDIPTPIVDRVVTNPMKLRPSKTNSMLEQAWEAHKPELWIFGHHHNDWRRNIEGTTFICLDELSYVDF